MKPTLFLITELEEKQDEKRTEKQTEKQAAKRSLTRTASAARVVPGSLRLD
jgi:hypothetical protein